LRQFIALKLYSYIYKITTYIKKYLNDKEDSCDTQKKWPWQFNNNENGMKLVASVLASYQLFLAVY